MFLSNQLISFGPGRSTGDDRASSERDARIPAASSQVIENTKVKCEKGVKGGGRSREAPLSS
jgi:hypothetical protein